jgi:23S rRNA-/tRNA-specific pseudouridylate synthase
VVGIEDGMMLRQLLARRLKVTPTAAAALVRAGGVYVGHLRMCVPTLRVGEGERVSVYRAAASARGLGAEALRVVHRDEACVIVDKPHGVAAAATKVTSRGSVAHALVQQLTHEKVLRPYVGLVHALPTAAAGLAVFTIRGQVTESFFKAFAELAMVRRYVVRIAGVMSAATMTCDAPVMATPWGGWRLARGTDGVATATVVTRSAALDEETLAEVTLTGGGTAGGEAVRLHLASLGLTLVGEAEHGGAAGVEAPQILCLLASQVAFVHPRTGSTVAAEAERPGWARIDEAVDPSGPGDPAFREDGMNDLPPGGSAG